MKVGALPEEDSEDGSGGKAEMLYTYDNAIHAFSTRLTSEEARLLKSQTGILKVLPEKIYKPLTTRTPHFLGLDKIVDMFPESNAGSDINIGFLDTGVWPKSKSFDDTELGPIFLVKET
ncbi:Subtilisin protease SBT1.7 [Spatholobus suberectus]|nr:Subtilisin protease SBT1.7 [Spatholobus suberectus]